MTIERAREIMGDQVIGPDEVNKLMDEIGFEHIENDCVPEVHFSEDILQANADDYILVLGYGGKAEEKLDIIRFRDVFGIDPDKREPCLYNQDWYLAESFVHRSIETRWYLVKRNVIESSRAEMPEKILDSGEINFPSAILCIYTFFAYYFSYGILLWYHDFVWCSDKDHNGDRIYVGKYNDVDGVNKNGFSIHRHLALRPCYAAIDLI